MKGMNWYQKIIYVLTFPFTFLFVIFPNAVDRWIFKFQSRKFRLTRPNCLFLINPSSGARLGEKIIRIVKTLKRPDNMAIDIFKENIVERVKEALASNEEPWHLIICGGDGTISTVVDKMERDLPETARDRIIYVPMALGTGNDMSRTLGFGGMVGLNFVNKFFNKIDSPRTSVVKMDRWNARVMLPYSDNPLIDVNWMLYLGIGFDGQSSYTFDQLRKKIPWFFHSNVNLQDSKQDILPFSLHIPLRI